MESSRNILVAESTRTEPEGETERGERGVTRATSSAIMHALWWRSTGVHGKALKLRQTCIVKERGVLIRKFACAVVVEGGNGEAQAHWLASRLLFLDEARLWPAKKFKNCCRVLP